MGIFDILGTARSAIGAIRVLFKTQSPVVKSSNSITMMVWSVSSYTKVFHNFNSYYLDAIIATSVIIKCAITPMLVVRNL